MAVPIPTPLFYWNRPWSSAHIYTDCPGSFREWAGQDFKSIRTAERLRGAARHTKGLCAVCWLTYQAKRDGRQVRYVGGGLFIDS